MSKGIITQRAAGRPRSRPNQLPSSSQMSGAIKQSISRKGRTGIKSRVWNVWYLVLNVLIGNMIKTY